MQRSHSQLKVHKVNGKRALLYLKNSFRSVTLDLTIQSTHLEKLLCDYELLQMHFLHFFFPQVLLFH